MRIYLKLQFKRVLRFFPFILTLTLILAIGTVFVASILLNSYNNSEEKSLLKLGITGDLDNPYLTWGIAAVKSLDDTRFSIEFIQLDEAEAQKQLSSGDLTAYIVLPPNFIENAVTGKIEPLRYVALKGAEGIGNMLEREVTETVADMIIEVQKGTYGIYDAAKDNGLSNLRRELQYKISLEYVELTLARNNVVNVEEIGVSDGVGLVDYYICGITVLFLMLIGLPFVTVYIRKDDALNKLLVSKGFSNSKQLIFEFIPLFTAIVVLASFVFLLILCAVLFMPEIETLQLPEVEQMISFGICLIPILLMISAFNLMIFEISKNIVSGVLLHFFISLVLCYVSGCFYPIYSFPSVIQKIQVFLPTGLARSLLASAFENQLNITSLLSIVFLFIVFFMASIIIRSKKMLAIGGQN